MKNRMILTADTPIGIISVYPYRYIFTMLNFFMGQIERMV